MTKKERILEVALELFANDGYSATSTSKIAKIAEVSEGLIFKHFENKRGLLDALIDQAKIKIQEILGPVLFLTDAEEVIKSMITIPFDTKEDDYDFWRLQYKIKWQKEYDVPDKLNPIMEKLSWAFGELGYENPDLEAQVLLQIMDSNSIQALQQGKDSVIHMRNFLLAKYGIESE